VNIRRRDILIAAGCIAAAPSIKALAVLPAGPPLWVATRGASKVYIFGFADAKDRSWLTPTLERAFRESRQIWFETPHPNPAADDLPPRSKLLDMFERDDQHSLFDVLPAALSERVLTAAKKYGVARDALEHQRPWHADPIASAGSLAVLHRGRSIGCVRRIQRSTNTNICDAACQPKCGGAGVDIDSGSANPTF